MVLRLKTLQLSWFRGAASQLILDTGGKSVAIYGPNGAGKSTLVDALEFVLSSGKVGYLANEYSGRRLEHAVPNTHAPAGTPATATVTLHDGKQASVTLGATGMARAIGSEHVAAWSPTRSILRQDAMASFVNSSKLDKYKAILPLLGFEPLEVAATNIRALKAEVEKQTQIARKTGELGSIHNRRQAAFPGMDGPSISTFIKELVHTYLPGAPPPASLQEAVQMLEPELQRRLDGLDHASTQHALCCQARDARLADRVAASVAADRAAARLAQPLIAKRLAVLRAANAYAAACLDSEATETIECPACGQPIGSAEFDAHIANEARKLEDATKAFDEMSVAHSATATALAIVQTALSNRVLSPLFLSDGWSSVKPSLDELLAIDPKSVEKADSSDIFVNLSELVDTLLPQIEAVASQAPISTQHLVSHRDAARAAAEWQSSQGLRKEIAEAIKLTDFLEVAEAAIRDEIRLQSAAVIDQISDEVAAMWAVLHPDEPIDGVGLYQHIDVDKAIDLKLRFHGKDLSSPRLTLSEGHRNSLGLCVFLALAKRGREPSPIILDDVVTSFDREHRACVTDLLLSHMSGLQIILLTHEYDWFIDLSNRLPGKSWSFQQFRPFADPAVGIQWGGVPSGFEPAKAILELDPSSAANKARGLLDVHLAVISERLKISMPFIRGPRNELRHADDMLRRFAGKANSSFRRRSTDGKHEQCHKPGQAADALKQLLIPFANPPSHGRIVPRGEAERIIRAGEAFLAALLCDDCKHPVTRSEVANKHMECECGTLRWLT